MSKDIANATATPGESSGLAVNRPVRSGLRRRRILLPCLALLILLGASPLIYRNVDHATRAAPPVPADLFMQSVITRDGELGWRQLCPTTQEQVTLDELRAQTEAQRQDEAGQGLTLNLAYVGAQPRLDAGELRIYVVTARRPNGWADQKTFTVKTRAGGCVEEVE